MNLFVIGDEVSGPCVSGYVSPTRFAVGVDVDLDVGRRRANETEVTVMLGPFALSIWWGSRDG